MLPTLLLLCLPNLPADPISFAAEVGRADRAIAALGKATGIPMKATGAVANEIIFLNIKALSVSEVMKSVAKVTCAEWTEGKDGTLTLNRSLARENAEKRKETNRKLAALEAWRTKLLRVLSVDFSAPFVKEKATLSALQDKEHWRTQRRDAENDELDKADPVNRALARCLQDLDLRPIANLRVNETAVFSSSPNSAQHPLPPGAQSALAKIQPEQIMWGNALQTMPDFALLRIKSGQDNYFNFELIMATHDGTPAVKFETSLWTIPEHPDSNLEKVKLTDPKPSRETKALVKRMAGSGPSVKGEIETLRPYFDDPVGHDFLHIGNQEALTSLARQRNRSVIACLPEQTSLWYNPKLEIGDLIGGGGLGDWITTEYPNRIELLPSVWPRHWRERADRTKIAPCVSSYRRTGQIDLESFVKLANRARHGDRGPAVIFTQLINPAYRASYGSFKLPYQSAFSELLAILTPEQLSKLKRGQTIPYGLLTRSQLALATQCAYGTRINTDAEGGAPNQMRELDPTFELPNGILTGTGLSAKVDEERLVIFHNPSDPQHEEFYGVNLTSPVGGRTGPGPLIPKAGMAAATYDIRVQRRFSLRCGLTRGHYVIGKFLEPLPPATSKPVPINLLPADVRRQIQSVVDSLERNYGRRKGDPASR